MNDVVQVPIRSDADIIIVRQTARTMAKELGFSGSNLTLIATAISELARNIVEYARQGEIILHRIKQGGHPGLVIIARDNGPGIVNIERAMQDGDPLLRRRPVHEIAESLLARFGKTTDDALVLVIRYLGSAQ